MSTLQETSENLLSFCGDKRYSTIYADPPWRFQNRTGKVAPENKKLNRYETMPLEDIMALPVEQVAAAKSHLYLWVPNALLPDGLAVMKAVSYTHLQTALSELADHSKIAVWVLKENTKAIRFYERCGYRFDGREQIIELGSPVVAARMVLER